MSNALSLNFNIFIRSFIKAGWWMTFVVSAVMNFTCHLCATNFHSWFKFDKVLTKIILPRCTLRVNLWSVSCLWSLCTEMVIIVAMCAFVDWEDSTFPFLSPVLFYLFSFLLINHDCIYIWLQTFCRLHCSAVENNESCLLETDFSARPGA